MAPETLARTPEFVHYPPRPVRIDKEQAARWLKQRMTRPCAYCGSTDWSLAEGVHALLPLAAGDYLPIRDPGRITPLVMVECHGCAQVALFNAVTMRLLPGTAVPDAT